MKNITDMPQAEQDRILKIFIKNQEEHLHAVTNFLILLKKDPIPFFESFLNNLKASKAEAEAMMCEQGPQTETMQ